MTAPYIQLETRALDPELARWAREAAKARGLTMSVYIGRLLMMNRRLVGLAVKGPLARSLLAEYGLQEIPSTMKGPEIEAPAPTPQE